MEAPMDETASASAAPRTSRTANIAGALGIAAPALAVLGVLLAQVGLPPMAGFYTFAVGLLCGLIALLLGLAGLILTRGGVGGRPRAHMGIGGGLLMIAMVFLGRGPDSNAPPINDITTNLADPPAFAPAPEGHRNAGRDMGYDPSFVPIVEVAYPDLASLVLALSQQQAYDVALAEAEAMGWEITRRDPAGYIFEAEDVSAAFRFVDDVVVRIGDDGAGHAVIDVRSKSRDGRGDIGANAARIRVYLERVMNEGSRVAAAG
jgi:hypothetical protein